MGESYTVNGDTWVLLKSDRWEGQIFTPVETHILHFVDLDLILDNESFLPHLEIREIDADGIPGGFILSKSWGVVKPLPPVGTAGRVRFRMGRVEVTAGQAYVILIRSATSLPPVSSFMLIDRNDATYPRGHRIIQNSWLWQWSDLLGDDIIFTEFGDPPLPGPDPPPPVEKQATFSLDYVYTEDGYHIITRTSSPCHAYLLYSTTKVEKHPRPIIDRGLPLMEAIKICFVNWKVIEQEEEGDTDYHTFICEPWAACTTWWFTFKATVRELWSPSSTPIFQQHRPYIAIFAPSLDGWVGRFLGGGGESWPIIAAGAGTLLSKNPGASTSLRFESSLATNGWIKLVRYMIFFDCRSLPKGIRITGAQLELKGVDKVDGCRVEPDLALCRTFPISDLDITLADYGNFDTAPIGTPVTFKDFKPDGSGEYWNYITIPASLAPSIIKRHEITCLGLRNYAYDMLTELEPGFHNPEWLPYGNRTYFRHWGNGAPLERRPRLLVFYEIVGG